MKISIEQTGGFAGISNSYNVDTERIPPNEAEKIKKIVQDGQLFSLSHPIPTLPQKGSADYQSFKVTLEDNETKHIVECNQFNIPNELRLLIDYVKHDILKK